MNNLSTKLQKIAFIDRDGTIIVEPQITKQVNSLEDLTFKKNSISSLKKLQDLGYQLIIITNQDGLGTTSNPLGNYEKINNKILDILESENISIQQILTCPHFAQDNCNCRKPKLGLVENFLKDITLDTDKSVMIGDRDSDIEFAKNLNISGYLLASDNNWLNIMASISKKHARTAKIKRTTKETDILVELNLDGSGKNEIQTGLKFFDHMLEQLSKHSNFDLNIKCKGDLNIDEHHSIEDVALTLGACFKQALGDKRGIERFSWQRILVMDESVIEGAIDLSGRPELIFISEFQREYIGDVPTELFEHFFRSFSYSSGTNLYLKINGYNTHHKIEACFKAFACMLKDAVNISSDKIRSTKGIL